MLHVHVHAGQDVAWGVVILGVFCVVYRSSGRVTAVLWCGYFCFLEL